MMNINGNEKAAGEILRSLLSSPKMQNSQLNEGNHWQDLEANYHFQDQIIWQIGSPKPAKDVIVEDENVIQNIPITYVASGSRNNLIAHTKTHVKPVTYVLTHNIMPETLTKCLETDESDSELLFREPQKIVFVQDSKSVKDAPETKVYSIASEIGTNFASDNGIVISFSEEILENELKDYKISKTVNFDNNNKSSSNFVEEVLLPTKKFKDGEESNTGKAKMEKQTLCKTAVSKKFGMSYQISKNKKPKKKKKNSKPKSKLKSNVKGIGKKGLKTTKNIDVDKSEGDGEGEGEKEKRNLFELTKLEDNVEQVAKRLKAGCECSDSNCFDGLNPDYVFKHRLNIADLTKEEHDMYLMGVIMASIQNLEETCRHKERIRIRSCYAYQGKKVCLTAFLYLQHVTLYQMKRLRSHLKNHGVSPRIHGNRGRKPANTFSLDIYRRASNFVQSYIEKYCVKTVPNFTMFSSNKIGSSSISGKTKSGKKPAKLKVANKMTSYHLPPDCTKKIVHKEYKAFCEKLKPNMKVMKYSTFTSFLKKQFPNVKFQKVDKKPEEKPEPNRIKNEKSALASAEGSSDKSSQTVACVPEKAALPTAFVVTAKAPHAPQLVFGGQRLQICSSSDLELRPVSLGNEMCEVTADGHHVYAADNIH